MNGHVNGFAQFIRWLIQFDPLIQIIGIKTSILNTGAIVNYMVRYRELEVNL